MSEKAITVELTEDVAKHALQLAEDTMDECPCSSTARCGHCAREHEIASAIRAALGSSTGPDPENSSGVGEAVRHHLELAIKAKDRQASDDRIRAALSMLDHQPPVPQSEPVVEGEPPLPVPSEELLRAQAIEDYLADARIPRPFPATQPEPSQETKGEQG